MSHPEKSGLTSQLRQAIAAEHDAIERTAFSVDLMQGRLSRPRYGVNLAQMYHIHGTLEAIADANPSLQHYFTSPMRRADVIERDLSALGSSVEQYPVMGETSELVHDLRNQAAADPLAMLGAIYVLEGSRMGSLVLFKPLAVSLHVRPEPNQGLDYHIDGARETPLRLKQWKALVDAAAFSESTVSAIEACAVGLMQGLLAMYAKIPSDDELRNVA